MLFSFSLFSSLFFSFAFPISDLVDPHNPKIMGIVTRSSLKVSRPGKASSNRGNCVASKSKYQLDSRTSVGKRPQNSIRNLVRKNHAGFGNRTSDGQNSQTGFLSNSGLGFQGDLTPILTLMYMNGHESMKTDYSYIASEEMVPTVYSAVDPQGRHGVQPTDDGPLMKRQVGLMVPPNQSGNCTGKHSRSFGKMALPMMRQKKNSYLKDLKIDRDRTAKAIGEITIPIYNWETIEMDKHGEDGDPNPIYPLAAADPVEQQAYRPNEIGGDFNVEFGATQWHGQQIQSGEDLSLTQRQSTVVDDPRASISNTALTRVGVDNYLWSRAAHGVGGKPTAPLLKPVQENQRPVGASLRN